MIAADFAPGYIHNYAAFQETQMAVLVRNIIQDPNMLASETKL